MDKPKDKRYITPAMGLFYLKKNDDIVPIAIQLGQQPGPNTPIWTPQQDADWDWIMAKLWLRCADTQCHQVHVVEEISSTNFVTIRLCNYSISWFCIFYNFRANAPNIRHLTLSLNF